MAVGVKNLRFKLPLEKESSLQEKKKLYITLYLKVPCGNFNSEKIRKKKQHEVNNYQESGLVSWGVE